MFEDELRACMEYGTVYKLASVKTWVALKRSRYLRHRNAAWQLYGYDIRRYGATFNDALWVQFLFDDMASKSGMGLTDYREYVTERASVDELKAQNSYFIRALYGA